MATVEELIKQDGSEDFTTLASWAASRTLGSDTYKGKVMDALAYDESFSIATGGTPTSSAYMWLTVDSAVRHAGVAGTGHARNYYTGANAQNIWVQEDWTRIEWLEFARDDNGNNERCIFVENRNDALIEYCIFWNDDATPGTGVSGVYVDDTDNDLVVTNSVFYNFSGPGMRCNQWGTGTGRTIAFRADHCTAAMNGTVSASPDGGIFVIQSNHASDAITTTFYNCSGVGAAFGDEWNIQNHSGTLTIAGSHNARTSSGEVNANYNTDTTSNWQDASDGAVDSAPGTAGAYFTNITTLASYDLTPVAHANNVLMGNGTDLQGSEPDARSDYSIAINGPRGTTDVDIGAFQVTSSGSALPPLVHHYTQQGIQ